MSFASLIGHDAVIRLLKGQIREKRIPHTALWIGPSGIGKAALARAFAKALECAQPVDGDACDACESCRKIEQGTSPDFLTVGPESDAPKKESEPSRSSGQIGIDQVRKLENWMSLTPHSGRWKIGVLDRAETMTDQAANACLKMLEEPPSRSLFILLTTAPNRLLPTIVSRCHRLRLSPQGVERVAAYLREKEKIEPAMAQMVAVASSGRLGMALEFLRTDHLQERNRNLDQMIQAIQRGDLEIPVAKLSRDKISENLEWYAAWLRDRLILQLQGDPSWIIHQDRMPELRAASKTLSAEALLQRLDRVYAVEQAIKKNASVKNALSVLLSHG